MSNTESTETSEIAEFAAVALESLTEAVRRALTGHMRRGELVPEWNGFTVVWVEPGKHLHEFPVFQSGGPAAIGVERIVPADTPTASRLERG